MQEVVGGRSTVDESALTGEALPVTKAQGGWVNDGWEAGGGGDGQQGTRHFTSLPTTCCCSALPRPDPTPLPLPSHHISRLVFTLPLPPPLPQATR